MRRIIASFLLLLSSVAYAGNIAYVEYATLEINGKQYEVPLANNQYKNDVYFLKRALNGDEEAREILLANKDEKLFYIGDTSPLWLRITKDKFEVLE